MTQLDESRRDVDAERFEHRSMALQLKVVVTDLRGSMRNTAPKDAAELEALETREWLESLDYVLQSGGPARVGRLLPDRADHARRKGVKQPFTANTPYLSTIPTTEEPPFPGSREIERRIKSLVRWNALAMVVKANKLDEGIGGHLSTY